MISKQLNNTQMDVSKSIPDKITAIRNIVISYEAILQGKSFDYGNKTWVCKGKAIAPSDIIDKTKGILNNFAEEANLFTGKDIEMFKFQWYDGCVRINSLCLNHDGCRAEHYPQIFKSFKDAFQNIGDIILGSKEDIKIVFTDVHQTEEQGEF